MILFVSPFAFFLLFLSFSHPLPGIKPPRKNQRTRKNQHTPHTLKQRHHHRERERERDTMCSNTSSGSYGEPDDYSGSCLKKHKKERVPRRGPGVAELEKILRQQEKSCTASVSASSSSPPLYSSPYPSSLPLNVIDQSLFGSPIPPPPPPPPLQPSSMTALYNSNTSFRPTPGNSCDLMPEKPPLFRPNNDILGCRTVPIFPFSSIFSNGSFPKDFIPPAPVFQMKQHSLNQFQTMNLPNPPPHGFYQFIEPPSNQRSCVDNAAQFLEEEKIVGAKRPRVFLTDTSPSSQMNKKGGIGPTITTSRDAKQSRSLDLRLKSSVPDYGTTSGNPITIDSPSPATPSTPIRTCPRDFSSSRFSPLALQYEQQEDIEEYMQRKTGVNVSINRKPFYSFLPSDKHSSGDEERSCSLKSERYETTGDHGIDLSLKL